jgi:hypothetical protein
MIKKRVLAYGVKMEMDQTEEFARICGYIHYWVDEDLQKGFEWRQSGDVPSHIEIVDNSKIRITEFSFNRFSFEWKPARPVPNHIS